VSISPLHHGFINILIASVPVFYSNTAIAQFLLLHLEEEGEKTTEVKIIVICFQCSFLLFVWRLV